MSVKSLLAASALLGAQLVAGHAAIIDATGDAGGRGMAIGVDPNTPRDGTRRNPFQQDATRFRGASAETVGETLAGGANSIESGTEAVMGMTGDSLPQVTQGGELRMTVHQVNADGAGPYTCMINSDGTGQDWQNIQVTQNLPGNNRGRNRQGNASDQPLTAAIPQNQRCTGNVAGQDNVCLVRCQNPARAGPFGGVTAVQMVSKDGAGGAAGGNGAGGNGAGGNGAGGNGAGGNGASGGNGAGGNGASGGNGVGGNGASTGNGAGGNGASTGKAAAGGGNAAGADAGAGAGAVDANAGRQGRQGRGGRRNRQGANAANNNPADDVEDERKVKRADAAVEEEEEEEEDAVLTKRAAFIKRIDEKTRAVEFTA